MLNLVRRMQNKTFGQDTEKGYLDEDDMGVRVGDNVEHHYHPPATASGTGSTLLPLALAAALGGGGAIAAFSVMNNDHPPPPAATDSVTELEIYRPGERE